MIVYREGDRVVLPDPLVVNPIGGATPQPFGPGVVLEVVPPKYTGGAPLLRVLLDSGEQRTIGSLFVKRESS